MQTFLAGHVAYLTDDGKAQMKKVVAALSAEAQLPAQAESDQQDQASGLLDEGRELIATSLDSKEDAEEDYSCIDCHSFRENEDGYELNLTGYGSEEWLVDLISNVDHDRFYGGDNDRMPIFHSDELVDNLLTREQIRLIARWLRGDDRVLFPGEGNQTDESATPDEDVQPVASEEPVEEATDEDSDTTD